MTVDNQELLRDRGFHYRPAPSGIEKSISLLVRAGVVIFALGGVLTLFEVAPLAYVLFFFLWIPAWGSAGYLCGQARNMPNTGLWLSLALGPVGCLIVLLSDKKKIA